jgi:predicted amidohydrolase
MSIAELESEDIRVGVAQMPCQLMRIQSNYRRARVAVEEAAGKGCRLVCLPEAFRTAGNLIELPSIAETIPGKTTDFLSELARKHNIHIVGGLFEKDRDQYFSSAVLLGPEGRIVGKYRRVHTFQLEKRYLTNGTGFECWDTEIGRIGLAIGYDIYFPESVRMLALKGADLIVVPALLPDEVAHSTRVLVQARAMESGCTIVFASGIGDNSMAGFQYMGSSLVTTDPILLEKVQFDYLDGDEVFSSADNEAQLLVADLPIAKIKKQRSKHMLSRDLEPSAYQYEDRGDQCVCS